MLKDQHPLYFNAMSEHFDSALRELTRKHALAVKDLDEAQLVEIVRQQILSGDILKNVYIGYGEGGSARQSSMTYIPYSGVERLKTENAELKRKLKLVEEALK